MSDQVDLYNRMAELQSRGLSRRSARARAITELRNREKAKKLGTVSKPFQSWPIPSNVFADPDLPKKQAPPAPAPPKPTTIQDVLKLLEDEE